MRRILVWMAVCVIQALSGGIVLAQDLHAPASVTAGDEMTISTPATGNATFYLVGPGISRRSSITGGETIRLRPDDLRNAGRYMVLLCSGTCQSTAFYVNAATPGSLTFLVHPSRVPVSQPDAISGVALPFDQFHNLVLTPVAVDFHLTSSKALVLSQPASTRNGVAWFRATSGKSAGMLEVTAMLGDLSVRRVVQQVASDPCNLSITGQQVRGGFLVRTVPVRDCAGDAVPDGTIVSFTATGANGKSTVDAPLKHGIAQAQIAASGDTVISVASGVVMGNELHLRNQP